MLTVALAKGRLAEECTRLLTACGVDCSAVKESGRRLVIESACGGYRFFMVKPSDVPTYVERGVADIGFVGKDTLLEEDKDIYELLDLGLGRCRMSICGFKDVSVSDAPVVATKYVNFAKRYFQEKGITADIIRLSGSVELAPLTGLSEVILDIVESGNTLKANGLVELQTVQDISARFVANKAALKTQGALIMGLKNRMQELLGGAND